MSQPAQHPAPKTLLVGSTGSGKTHSLRTVLEADPFARLFVVFTEPGQEVLADLPQHSVHWRYIPPMAPSWSAMIAMAEDMNRLSMSTLQGRTDPNKSQYTEFVDVLRTLESFRCDRCGQDFGGVEKFGKHDFLAIDSLSGINIMAMSLVAGARPIKQQADWGMAMNAIQNFVIRLTSLYCPVILTAHLEKEFDEATSQSTLMASTLGKKLAPTLPRFFSDVVLAKREGKAFSWSTAAINVDLKARNLPIADNLTPSFRLLYDAWSAKYAAGANAPASTAVQP